MAALTINKLFYNVSHYDPEEKMGDGSTTVNTQLQSQYIPIAVKIFKSITDLSIVTSGTADAVTFGSAYEYENQVAAYIASYLAEVDLNPKELHSDMSSIWASKYMQQALQLIQSVYPDRVEAKTVGGIGMVWVLKPEKTNNISVMIGAMRSSSSGVSFGSEPGANEPTSTSDAYGR